MPSDTAQSRLHLHCKGCFVDDDAERNGDVLPAEDLQLLRFTVLEDLEGVSVQIGQQLASFVGDASVQDDQAGIGAKLSEEC